MASSNSQSSSSSFDAMYDRCKNIYAEKRETLRANANHERRSVRYAQTSRSTSRKRRPKEADFTRTADREAFRSLGRALTSFEQENPTYLHEMVDCDDVDSLMDERERDSTSNCQPVQNERVHRSGGDDMCAIKCTDPDATRMIQRGIAYVGIRFELEHRRKEKKETNEKKGKKTSQTSSVDRTETPSASQTAENAVDAAANAIMGKRAELRMYRGSPSERLMKQRLAAFLSKHSGKKITPKKAKQSRSKFLQRLNEAVSRRPTTKTKTKTTARKTTKRPARGKKSAGKRTAAQVCEASVRRRASKAERIIRAASGKKKLTKREKRQIRDITVRASRCKARLASKRTSKKSERERSTTTMKKTPKRRSKKTAKEMIKSMRTIVTRSMTKKKKME